MKVLRTFYRAIRKGFSLFFEILSAVWDYKNNVWGKGLHHNYKAKASWLQKWSQRVLKALNISYSCAGIPPKNGMLASTHVSYLDILVIAANIPTIFVAKQQVRSWPLIGWITSLAGTLYVSREHRGDVKRVTNEFLPILEEGIIAVVFPEGTSTNSHEVRPFFSSLLEPCVKLQMPVTGAWIGYKVSFPYTIEKDVCFWGDMGFVPHILRLLCTTQVEAKLIFGKSIQGVSNRKQVACDLREDIIKIAKREGAIS